MTKEKVLRPSVTCKTFKTKTAAAILAAAGAVALPQVFHAAGALLGAGPALGQALLPMHLPVLLAGFLAGPAAGLAAGALAPLISFFLSGMPSAALLPFMVLELAGYGAFAGLLSSLRIPSLLKVIAAQTGGRALRAVAILIAFYGFGSAAVPVSLIWTSIAQGLPGLILQWISIPLLLYLTGRKENSHD